MGSMVHLRLAEEIDFEFFYEIKSDADNVFWTGYNNPPDRNRLYTFFTEQIKNQLEQMKRKIYIISNLSCYEERYGYLYLDPIDEGNATVSIAVLERYSGQGIGRRAMEKLCDTAKTKGFRTLIAEIREDNKKSQKMFANCGFIKSDLFKLMNIKNLGKKVKMVKYSKKL